MVKGKQLTRHEPEYNNLNVLDKSERIQQWKAAEDAQHIHRYTTEIKIAHKHTYMHTYSLW